MRRSALFLAASLLAVVGCASRAGDETGSSDDAVAAEAPRLLAIGDSITFAWNPLLESDPHKVDAKNYSGFAEIIGAAEGWKVDNAACPGEASGSFLDVNAKDNGCDDNRAAYALHHDWAGQSTQAAFVEKYLGDAVAAGKPPRLVTLTLGGNDLLLMQKSCQMGFLTGPCELTKLPFYGHGYEENLQKIFADVEGTGYAGPLVVMTTYAPDYSDTVATIGLKEFNAKLREAVGEYQRNNPDSSLDLVVADAYGAFEAAAKEHGGKTCQTGLLIQKPDGTCDIHPTQQGHQLIAKTMLDAVRAAQGE